MSSVPNTQSEITLPPGPISPTIDTLVSGGQGLEGGDSNPNAPAAGGGFSFCTDPGENNPAEPRLNATLHMVADREGPVRTRWEQRVAAEGTPYWVCPFERGASRQKFTSPDKCQTYMDENFKSQIEEAKLTGKPEKEFTPLKQMADPKRVMTDFYDPETAARMQGAVDAAKTVQPIIDQLGRNMQRPGRNQKLLHAAPHELPAMLRELSDKDLAKAYGEGNSMGKIHLARAARKETERRKAAGAANAAIVAKQ